LEETLQRGASDNVTLIIVRCAHKTMVSDDDIAGREFEGRRA